MRRLFVENGWRQIGFQDFVLMGGREWITNSIICIMLEMSINQQSGGVK